MNKSFYYLWVNISFGKLSISLLIMTITFIIFLTTNSATFASLVMLVYVIGKLLSSFILPVISERVTLKRIINASLFIQLLIIVLILVLLKIEFIQLLRVTLIYSLVGLLGFMDGFCSPTRMALIPEVVENKVLGRANSLISTTDQTFSLLGWSLGAVVIHYYGGNVVIISSLILGIISFLSSLQFETNKINKTKSRMKCKYLIIGWSILFSKQNHMRTITAMDVIEGIASGIWVGGITLVFVLDVLQKGEQWWGFINTSYYAGSILGGILIALYSKKLQKHLLFGIVIGSLLVSILVFLYAMNSNAWIALILVVLMGPFYQLRDISQQTYIQTVTARNELSKVYAAKDNVYYLIFAFSVFITGLISDYLGVVYVYYFAFFLYLLSTIVAVTTFRKDMNNKVLKTESQG
ncbi:MFS transporter [Bacillus solimangrovi]|uniref:MFS transporter n=1 Tax=Bacillus solimangrovi TaxID=1305675 RepID=A0A1E5LK87_9BACI|nr:MFS transporter [Bacillus solimangrovi]OEH94446.1 hypothetical protein BFG57_08270 [Bacillus solimangrovi]